MNRKKLIILTVLILLTFIAVNTFIHERKEFTSKFEFIISKIEITPTKQMIFYNAKGEKISLWNYTVMSNEDVKVGDSIYKASCSKFLYIFRKNSVGRAEQLQQIAPTNLFPYKWFCE